MHAGSIKPSLNAVGVEGVGLQATQAGGQGFWVVLGKVLAVRQNMSYSLNSLQGLYRGLYRVLGLGIRAYK